MMFRLKIIAFSLIFQLFIITTQSYASSFENLSYILTDSNHYDVEDDSIWEPIDLITENEIVNNSQLFLKIDIPDKDKDYLCVIAGFPKYSAILENNKNVLLPVKEVDYKRVKSSLYKFPKKNLENNSSIILRIPYRYPYELGEIEYIGIGKEEILEIYHEYLLKKTMESTEDIIFSAIFIFLSIMSFSAAFFLLRSYSNSFKSFAFFTFSLGLKYLQTPLILKMLPITTKQAVLLDYLLFSVVFIFLFNFIGSIFFGAISRNYNFLILISAIYTAFIIFAAKSILWFNLPELSIYFYSTCVFINIYFLTRINDCEYLSLKKIFIFFMIFLLLLLFVEFLLLKEIIEVSVDFFARGIVFLSVTLGIVIVNHFQNNLKKINLANEKLKQHKLEKLKLKEVNLQSRLQNLTNQMHPHFFFNILNTLAAIIETDKKTAIKFVSELSKMFRYFLREHQTLTILEKELDFLDSFLFLSQKRYDAKLIIKIEVDEIYNSFLLPPFTLQTLTENAIKHNQISKENILKIEIFVKDSFLIITNNITIPKREKNGSTGIGLKNLSERYKLIQGRNIIIENDSKNFTVRVPLIEKEDENV